jgi:hypothetical protein
MLLVALCCIDVADVPGQDGKNPQAANVSPGLTFLEKFVGDFDVEKIMYASGTPKKTKGTCKQTMQQGGKILVSDFTFGEGAAATTGMGMIAYVEGTALFTSAWVDSRQSKMSLRQSREKFNGQQIVLFSGTLNNDEKARVSRTISTLEEDGKKILHRQFNIAEGKESLFMELHMKRK